MTVKRLGPVCNPVTDELRTFQMKTLKYAGLMKKKSLMFIAAPFALVLIGGIVGQAWLKSRFERDSIVEKMEAQWNCRVSLDSTSISLFSSPAKIELKGLRFSQRDEEVGKPLGQRAVLDEKNILMAANHVILAVKLEDIICGRLCVTNLQITDFTARAEVDEKGVSSLEALFKTPAQIPSARAGADANQASRTVSVGAGSAQATGISVEEVSKKKMEHGTQEKNTPFNAEDMRISLTVEEAGVENAKIEISSRKNGIQVTLEKIRFEFKGIDVIPSDLANHNHCGFYFEGGIRVEDVNHKVQIANYNLSGTGSLRPFDMNTGELSPDLNLEVTVKKEGLIGGTLLARQLDKKDLKKLNDYGLELGDIALGGVLQEDVTTQIHHVRGKLYLKKDTRLVFPQYEITLLEKSWFNAQQDGHLVHARLVVNQDLSSRLLDGAKKSLSAKYGENIASLGIGVLGTILMDDQKRIAIPFKSKGSLSKPEVDMDTVLNDAKDLLKDAGKSLLQGLLGK